MNKSLSIIVGIIIVVLVGWFVWQQKQDSLIIPPNDESMVVETATTTEPAPEASSSQEEASPTPAPTPAPAKPAGITLADVATHNSRTSCWSVINGSVYDLTSWIPNHPGGERAILQLCGVDGSAKFNAQHGGAAKQAAVLAGFKIGTLSQ